MSGRKINDYVLTEEERRIIVEEIERECRARELDAWIAYSGTKCAGLESLASLSEAAARLAGPGDGEEIRRRAHSLSQAAQSARTAAREGRGEEAKRQIDAHLRGAAQDAAYLEGQLRRVNARPSGAPPASAGALADELLALCDASFAGLDANSECAVMHARLRARIEELALRGDRDGLLRLRAFEVEPFAQLARAKKAEANACRAEYDALAVRCAALSDVAGVPGEPLPPCERKSLPLLRARADRLEHGIAKAREAERIAAALDRAMREMGYFVVGGMRGAASAQLYRFGEHTGIHALFSADGRITMEVVGFAQEDRIPTQGETAALVEEMQRFCGDFDALERRLSEAGVGVRRRVERLSAAAENATLVNLSEYELERGVTAEELLPDRAEEEARLPRAGHLDG